MSTSPFVEDASGAVPLYVCTPDGFERLQASLSPAQLRWAHATRFTAEPGTTLLLPGENGELAGVIVGIDAGQPLWQLAALPRQLPAGSYTLANEEHVTDVTLAALGWAIGALPRRAEQPVQQADAARLVLPRTKQDVVRPLAEAIRLVRNLVNAPANQLGPAELASVVRALAQEHDADYDEWVGDDLPGAGFPLVHAVGRAAAPEQAPRVSALHWGDPAAPRVVLVGKGVCFDSGGLDVKPAQNMRWMKKDMGGAAHAIALARLVMQARLSIRLTLVVPAVENAVGAGALRPGDILQAGNGRTVEIENTDAEGRLILADALHHALRLDRSNPAALAIDLATLTGAARVALGPDLPALFSNDDRLATALLEHADSQADPLWRLPLWQPYRDMLKSNLADSTNASPAQLAGALTAALFLEAFVPADTPWLHVDLFAWNQEERPGRPRGGEAQGLRALFSLLAARFPPA